MASVGKFGVEIWQGVGKVGVEIWQGLGKFGVEIWQGVGEVGVEIWQGLGKFEVSMGGCGANKVRFRGCSEMPFKKNKNLNDLFCCRQRASPADFARQRILNVP